jgi:hypothetical protein
MIWEEDFKTGKKAEHEFAALLIMKWVISWWREPKWKFSYWDMELETPKWDITVEVKNDNLRPSTGCIWIEYECKWVPSWIAISKADYYVYKLGNDFWMAQRSKLINLLLTSTTKKDCQWGDDWTAKLWVIPESEFYSIAKKVWTEWK